MLAMKSLTVIRLTVNMFGSKLLTELLVVSFTVFMYCTDSWGDLAVNFLDTYCTDII